MIACVRGARITLGLTWQWKTIINKKVPGKQLLTRDFG